MSRQAQKTKMEQTQISQCQRKVNTKWGTLFNIPSRGVKRFFCCFFAFLTAVFLFFFTGNVLMHVFRYCGLPSLGYWKHVLRYSFTAGKFNYLQLSFNTPKFQHKQSKIHMSTITCIKTPVIRADIGKIYYYLRNTNQSDFYNKLLFYCISMTSAGFFFTF